MTSGSIVTMSIKANGEAISDTADVLSLEVQQDHSGQHSALVVLALGDPATGLTFGGNAGLLVPGAEMEISAGYDNKNDSIFDGTVVAQHLRLDGEAVASLEIEAHAVYPEVEFEEDAASVLTLTYGDNIYAFQRTWEDDDDPEMAAGQVRIQGTSVVEPGSIVTLDKVGDNFGGNALVSGVHHTISEGNWWSLLQLGMAHGSF